MMGLEGLMGYGGSGPFLVNGASVDLSMLLATAQQNAEDLLRMAGSAGLRERLRTVTPLCGTRMPRFSLNSRQFRTCGGKYKCCSSSSSSSSINSSNRRKNINSV